MSQITNGLVNDGNTGHFSISYESSLSPADGRTVAQGLMNVIEGDLVSRLMLPQEIRAQPP